MSRLHPRPGAAALAGLALLACSAAVCAQVRVDVTPEAVRLRPGERVTFQASVRGAPRAVIAWGLAGPPGADAGRIDADGTYTAPAAATPDPVRVVATALDPGGRLLGSATAEVLFGTTGGGPPGAPAPWVEVTPRRASVAPGATLALHAHTGGADVAGIRWSVHAGRPGVDVGAVGADGVYRAPPSPPGCGVRVVATALGGLGEPLACAVVPIEVVPPAHRAGFGSVRVAVEPSRARLGPGGRLRLTILVEGVDEPRVRWTLHGPEGAGRGAITPEGVYTAPARPPFGPVRAVATLVDVRGAPIACGSCLLEVAPEPPGGGPVGLTVSPGRLEVPCGARVRLHVRSPGGHDRLEWRLYGPGRGPSPRWGGLSPDGVYTAPDVPPGAPVRACVTALGAWGEPIARASCLIDVVPRPAPPPQAVSVRLWPDELQMRPGERQGFRAEVGGVPRGGSVRWSLHAQRPRKGPVGSVDEHGVYTAPRAPVRGRVLVVATVLGAFGEPLAAGSALVHLVPDPPEPVEVAVTPRRATVGPGDTVRFEARVAGRRRARVTWSLGAQGGARRRLGRIGPSGSYRAPKVDPGHPVHVIATVLGRRGRVLATASATVHFGRATGDYGDAPDGTRGRAEAYPGVRARFPTFGRTRHADHPGANSVVAGEEMLGRSVSKEADAGGTLDEDGRPNHVDGDSDDARVRLVRLPDGRFRIETDVTVAPRAPALRRYLNVLVDLDRDGRWKESLLKGGGRGNPIRGRKGVRVVEWVVRNLPVDVRPGTTAVVKSRPFSIPDAVRAGLASGGPAPWMRLVLSRRSIPGDGWIGAGRFSHGEVEDRRLQPADVAALRGSGAPAPSPRTPGNTEPGKAKPGDEKPRSPNRPARIAECARLLATATGHEHKQKGRRHRIPRGQYLEATRSDIRRHLRSPDPARRKCSGELWNWLNRASKADRAWLAALYVETYLAARR